MGKRPESISGLGKNKYAIYKSSTYFSSSSLYLYTKFLIKKSWSSFLLRPIMNGGAFIILILHKIMRPRDWTHWWEATWAFFNAWLWYLPITRFIFNYTRSRRCRWRCGQGSHGILEWSPTFNFIKFLNVWVEVNPNGSFFQLGIVL